MTLLRQQVLAAFRHLHRTRKKVFSGDEYALSVVRDKINQEFFNNKNVSDVNKIQELLKTAEEVETVVRKSVIQAVKKEDEDNTYRVVMRDDMEFLDTPYLYQPMPEHMIGPFKKGKPCSSSSKDKGEGS